METMTLAELSELLKITVHTARNRISFGMSMPPSFKVGKRRLFLKKEVELWFQSQKDEPTRALATLSSPVELPDPTHGNSVEVP